MKHIAVVLLTLRLLVACSEQPEVRSRADLSQLNSLEQEDLKQELLSEMREKAKARMTENAEFHFSMSCHIPSHQRISTEIKFNSHKEMDFRGKPISHEEISNEIFKYYNTNRSLRQDEIGTIASTPNYKYPLYSRMSRAEIVNALKREREMLEKAKKSEHEDFVEFHTRAIRNWKEKLRVIDILQTKELKEVRHLLIEIINEYDSIGFSRAADSVLVGIYKIRNAVALDYFGESYLSIYLRHKVLKNKQSADRLMAIEYLYPLTISDQPYLTSIHVIEKPLPYSIYFIREPIAAPLPE